jgi:hypothetical protein
MRHPHAHKEEWGAFAASHARIERKTRQRHERAGWLELLSTEELEARADALAQRTLAQFEVNHG